jgi:acyl-CoA dehydrogenase family protein 9
MEREEQQKVAGLIRDVHEVLADYDPRRVEEERWVGDDVIRGLGERGLLGLYVSPKYGGQGLSQTGYCRVMQEFSAFDGSLSVVMGVHQSIGMKPIHLFGSNEQKERFLPDLASGRKLAGFALTEPEAGSDAYHMRSRAELQADGSYRLNGEKRFIGNGSKDVLVAFANSDQGHVALILEKGMKGLEVGPRFDTMGLRGNDLRPLRFNDIRVPKENLLGTAGEGFRIAMHTLNNGRMSLGTGAVGGAQRLIDLGVQHVQNREQFGMRLADFELVEEKISWMVSYLFGLESMAYLTTGMVDAGISDYSIESALCKVSATEFLWYAANRVFQLVGGKAYMRDEPYERILRDIRIHPIFEGANDVLRAFIALAGLKAVSEEVADLAHLNLSDPIGAIGTLADYAVGRIRRMRAKLTAVHAALAGLAEPIPDQVRRLRDVSEKLLRTHREDIKFRQWHQKRLAHAVTDIYAQVAVLSRVTALLEDQGEEASGQERYIADTFCTRARRRVERQLDQIEDNDDERMHSIARLTYRRGGYGLSLYPS